MNSSKGVLAALGAFTLWGILPVYWKLLDNVPAFEILCHRIIWSLFVTLTLIFLCKRGGSFLTELKSKKNLLAYTSAALLLSVNWFIFIWAVNSGHIVEASLGYYINPLFNVLLGMIFFGEKMRIIQVLALVFALIGVVYLTVYYGKFPWIALALAATFALYGLFHKKNVLPALDGLCLETGVLFIPALVILLGLSWFKGEPSGGTNGVTLALLVGTGLITSAPLLLFGYAAQNIRFSTLGMLQYLAPTINLFLGVFVYNEDFPHSRFIGFLLIWIALVLYLVEGLAIRYRENALKLNQ